jgi:hypothetical protein
MFPLISSITQQQQQHSHKQPTNPAILHQKTFPQSSIKKLLSGSLLYPVINKEVEQQFSARWVTL